jgi:hypothetical protein
MISHKPSLRVFALIGGLAFVSALCGHAEDSSSQLRVKEFAVMGYEGLRYELHGREGSYTTTLMELLNVEKPQRAEISAKVRTLLDRYPNIMDFAEQVVQLRAPASTVSTTTAQMALPTGPHIYSGDRLENALNHLTRGMSVTVHLKTGARVTAPFEEYTVRRLWLKGQKRQSFRLDDIVAIEAPQL